MDQKHEKGKAIYDNRLKLLFPDLNRKPFPTAIVGN